MPLCVVHLQEQWNATQHRRNLIQNNSAIYQFYGFMRMIRRTQKRLSRRRTAFAHIGEIFEEECCLDYCLFSLPLQPPQLPEQPEQCPEQVAPSGHPIHLTPRFFALWMYRTAPPSISTRMTATRAVCQVILLTAQCVLSFNLLVRVDAQIDQNSSKGQNEDTAANHTTDA